MQDIRYSIEIRLGLVGPRTDESRPEFIEHAASKSPLRMRVIWQLLLGHEEHHDD